MNRRGPAPWRPQGPPPPGPGGLLDSARENPLLALALALAAVHFVAVIVVAASRLAYPYELDWVEGALLEETRRVHAGLPVYAAPSVAYVPLIYAPLFNYVSAAMAGLVGLEFTALRLVSALASAAMLVILGVHVRGETGRLGAGVLAAAVYVAARTLAESWLDVGRNDSLYLALVLAGALVYRSRARGLVTLVVAGAVWALAFLTKQSTVIVLAPLLGWLIVRERLRGGVVAAAFIVLAVIGVVAINAMNGGWFLYYGFIVPRKFPLSAAHVWRFLPEMVPLIPAFALGVVGAVARLRTHGGGVGFNLALAAGLAFSSWHLRLYPGAGLNVNMSATLAAAIAGGLGYGWLTAGSSRRLVRIAATLVMCLQLAILLRDPRSEIPSAQDREAGDELVRHMALASGPVYVPTHPYLARRAGKPTHVHIVPLMDMVRGPRDSLQAGLWQAVKDSLRTRAWNLLILDRRDWMIEEAEAAGYRVISRVFDDDEQVFWPVTGYRTRPEWVFAPAELLGDSVAAARSTRLEVAPAPGAPARATPSR